MTTSNPWPGYMARLTGRVTADFGLAERQPAERDEMLSRIVSLVVGAALARADEFLDDDANNRVEEIMNDSSVAELERAAATASYIASAVPELGRILDEEYERFLAAALKTVTKDRDEAMESADKTAEAAGDLLEGVKSGVEDAGFDSPGASALAVGFDLFFDPARFLRSPVERQQRFFKHVAELTAKAMMAVWTGLLLFFIAVALERLKIVGSLPRFLKEAVPEWFARQSLGGQALALFMAAAIGALVALAVVIALARAGSSPHLTWAFELKVSDEDMVSKVLERPPLKAILGASVLQRHSRGLSQNVYTAVLLRSRRADRDDFKILDQILKAGDEKAAAAFVKSKVRGYRGAIQAEAQRLCREADEIMSAIH